MRIVHKQLNSAKDTSDGRYADWLSCCQLHFASLKLIHECPPLKLFMEAVWGTLRVLQVGVQSNWFGLACPAHCGSPTFGALLASFLLGFITCLVLAVGFAIWIWCPSFLPAQHQVVEPTGASRLARYIDPAFDAFHSRSRRR